MLKVITGLLVSVFAALWLPSNVTTACAAVNTVSVEPLQVEESEIPPQAAGAVSDAGEEAAAAETSGAGSGSAVIETSYSEKAHREAAAAAAAEAAAAAAAAIPGSSVIEAGAGDAAADAGTDPAQEGEGGAGSADPETADSPDTDGEGAGTGQVSGLSLYSLGLFHITGYCPCSKCSEGWGRKTSTGKTATSSHTIAVDPAIIPYGTKVMIGNTVYTAEDRGGAVKGKHVDIFFDEHSQTSTFGSQTQEVFLIL